MWMWVDMHTYPTAKWWQSGYSLPALMMWLHDRGRRHTDWLNDSSKYVDIRFDSRTGNFLVRHDILEKILVWED